MLYTLPRVLVDQGSYTERIFEGDLEYISGDD